MCKWPKQQPEPEILTIYRECLVWAAHGAIQDYHSNPPTLCATIIWNLKAHRSHSWCPKNFFMPRLDQWVYFHAFCAIIIQSEKKKSFTRYKTNDKSSMSLLVTLIGQLIKKIDFLIQTPADEKKKMLNIFSNKIFRKKIQDSQDIGRK